MALKSQSEAQMYVYKINLKSMNWFRKTNINTPVKVRNQFEGFTLTREIKKELEYKENH